MRVCVCCDEEVLVITGPFSDNNEGKLEKCAVNKGGFHLARPYLQTDGGAITIFMFG